MVPSNKLWVNSKFVIEPKQKITLSASGYVNLAVHRIVSSAEYDTMPPYPWSGSEGTRIDLPLHKRRKGLLVEKRALLGQLLYAAIPTSEIPPSESNPRPNRIYTLTSNNSYKNTGDEPETLYFTVNEKLLEDSKEAKYAFTGKKSR